MSTYAEAGVNISEGDKASESAYLYAKKTFSSRNGMIGTPLVMDGGFAGALDMGEYYLINNCDGVGTKIDIALETQNFAGLGYDLLAMVADDAICVGSEIISITNTFDTQKVNAYEISEMMKSLSEACIQEKVIIPGGEIAELGKTLQGTIWNASATGISEKEKFITGNELCEGDKVIALKENGFRANGFSLVRYILKNAEISYSDNFLEEKSWGDVLLTPCTLYHNAVLSIIGRFGEASKAKIKGAVHVTGGGLAGNFHRLLKKKKLGAYLPNIFPMPFAMKKLQEIGNVSDKEAYKTWNGGNGMLLICEENQVETIISLLKKQGIEACEAGSLNNSGIIRHSNFGNFSQNEKMLEWSFD